MYRLCPIISLTLIPEKTAGLEETRHVSSMNHSARPTVPPGATIIFCCFVLLDLKSGDGTDVRTNVRTTCAKIIITTGRDCGPAEWINKKVAIHGNPAVSEWRREKVKKDSWWCDMSIQALLCVLLFAHTKHTQIWRLNGTEYISYKSYHHTIHLLLCFDIYNLSWNCIYLL